MRSSNVRDVLSSATMGVAGRTVEEAESIAEEHASFFLSCDELSALVSSLGLDWLAEELAAGAGQESVGLKELRLNDDASFMRSLGTKSRIVCRKVKRALLRQLVPPFGSPDVSKLPTSSAEVRQFAASVGADAEVLDKINSSRPLFMADRELRDEIGVSDGFLRARLRYFGEMLRALHGEVGETLRSASDPLLNAALDATQQLWTVVSPAVAVPVFNDMPPASDVRSPCLPSTPAWLPSPGAPVEIFSPPAPQPAPVPTPQPTPVPAPQPVPQPTAKQSSPTLPPYRPSPLPAGAPPSEDPHGVIEAMRPSVEGTLGVDARRPGAWSVEDVCALAVSLGIDPTPFRSSGIDGSRLMELSEEEIAIDLGVGDVGRLALREAIGRRLRLPMAEPGEGSNSVDNLSGSGSDGVHLAAFVRAVSLSYDDAWLAPGDGGLCLGVGRTHRLILRMSAKLDAALACAEDHGACRLGLHLYYRALVYDGGRAAGSVASGKGGRKRQRRPPSCARGFACHEDGGAREQCRTQTVLAQ